MSSEAIADSAIGTIVARTKQNDSRVCKNDMTNSTDSLSDLDWETARSWVDRLRVDPDNELLLVEFEEWLGDKPLRAAAYRKLVETIELVAVMKRDLKDCRSDSPGSGS